MFALKWSFFTCCWTFSSFANIFASSLHKNAKIICAKFFIQNALQPLIVLAGTGSAFMLNRMGTNRKSVPSSPRTGTFCRKTESRQVSATNLGQIRFFSVGSCSAPDEIPVFATYLLITIRTPVGRSHALIVPYNCLLRSFQESQAKEAVASYLYCPQLFRPSPPTSAKTI
jgi:hypothetical protein